MFRRSIKSKVMAAIDAKIKSVQKAHDEGIKELKEARRQAITLAHVGYWADRNIEEEKAVGSIIDKIL